MTPPVGVLQLVFVRHGRASDVEGRCIGQFDAPLSADGVRQVESHDWSAYGADGIISSDLSRAHDSAKLIAAQLSLSVTLDGRLGEMDFGEWDGRAWSELESEDGQRLSFWMEHWQTAAAPGGETVEDLFGRVTQALRWIVGSQHTGALTIIVVAHAGSIRAALCVLRNQPVSSMFDIVVEHATPILVTLDDALRERLRALPDR
ncbi:MAG: histidine phosphatase family protein [Gemmatimonas sp.]